MKARNKILSAVILLALTMMVSGCNMFEAVDSSVNNTTVSDLISEGNDRLSEGDFATALNRFERVLEKTSNDEARRGRASAYAGLSGFDLLSTLDIIQNGIVAPNSSSAIFQASKRINSLDNLNRAIDDMNLLNNPTKEDLLFRGLMASVSVAKTLIVKYDTNMNSKLDNPDQVNFTTNDKKTKKWEELYSLFSSSSSPYSIEKSYIDLSKAFEGRGSQWKTMSPFSYVTKTGDYTQANYNTIVAVGDLGQKLIEANKKYNNSINEFKTAILALDGVD